MLASLFFKKNKNMPLPIVVDMSLLNFFESNILIIKSCFSLLKYFKGVTC